MLPLPLLALLAGAPAEPGRALAEAALARALAVPGATAQLLDYHPALERGCAPASAHLDKPLSASGRFAVRLEGEDPSGRACAGWAWARVKVVASVIVAARALRPGDPLEGATAVEERELHAGREPLTSLRPGARAAQFLVSGTPLEPRHLRDAGSPAPGEAITVLVQSGSIGVALEGRAVSCAAGRACAQLPSGRRVEGHLVDRQLVVEVP